MIIPFVSAICATVSMVLRRSQHSAVDGQYASARVLGAADNPWEAVGSAAQQVVNAAREDAKRTLDEAGKRRDQLLAQGEKAVEDAKARAAETTAKADETARRTVADAKAKADHLLQEADEHTAAARAQGEQLIRDAQGQAERIIAEATAKADEQEKRAQDARDSYADIRARLVELAKAMGEVK